MEGPKPILPLSFLGSLMPQEEMLEIAQKKLLREPITIQVLLMRFHMLQWI